MSLFQAMFSTPRFEDDPKKSRSAELLNTVSLLILSWMNITWMAARDVAVFFLSPPAVKDLDV